MTTQLIINPINRSFGRCGTLGFLFIPLVLACFALLPRAQAVVPAPDGGYPNGNTAEGTNALFSLTNGVWNTAVGFEALSHDTAGKINTATGVRALFSNTSGSNNTANGVYALYGNINGWYNNAVGAYALANNISGNYNTANGYAALYRNTASYNTATGYAALYHNTGGVNTANGYQALFRNTTGTNNTANGVFALYSNTTGSANTANGEGALLSNTTGSQNTATGFDALANSTGVNNIALGFGAGLGVITANNVIAIGTSGANMSNSCFIGQIFGATSSGGTAVFINSDGKLGTTTSSRRFKEEIKPMEQASEALFALKPVTFRYKKEVDPEGIPQFGLVAEEVEKVNRDLVTRDAKGEVYTVRYEAVNAMLLNEFLKEHRNGQKQDATIAQLKSTVAQQQRDFQSAIAQQQKEIQALTSSLNEQASQLRKVSGHFEINRSASRLVVKSR
jgi:hypothetical protein